MKRKLSELIPAANPDRILVDFESATIGAFRQAYPNAHVSGCYFYLGLGLGLGLAN